MSTDLLSKEMAFKDDKGLLVPRKRGRPPKVRDAPVPMEGSPSSNGTQEEREHFWCAPGETSVREDKVPRRKMSLLKSSGAKSFLAALPSSTRRAKAPLLSPQGGDPHEIKRDVKPQEDIMISVKTENIGKIKTEKVSPKGTLKDQKLRPPNGISDAIFEGLGQKDVKTLLLPPPPLDRKTQDGLKTEQEPETAKNEEKLCIKRRGTESEKPAGRASGVESSKNLKFSKVTVGRGKNAKMKAGRSGGLKVRKKASLLSYLKEKNNESDASNGDPTEPVEDDLHKLIEKDDCSKKGNKMPSPYTGYPSITVSSIRGRRTSGTGRGKSMRKPKHCHGWSWEGDSHESKVWLRVSIKFFFFFKQEKIVTLYTKASFSIKKKRRGSRSLSLST